MPEKIHTPNTVPDSKPAPPEKPLASDCCDSGCERCVFDIYADENAAYLRRLKAWQARPDHGPS